VGSSLATLAWAEAVNSGAAAEVEGLLSKAFALCPESNVPTRARVLYCAGRAYSALRQERGERPGVRGRRQPGPKGQLRASGEGRRSREDDVVTVLIIVVAWALLYFWQRWIRGVLAAQLAAYRSGDYEAQMRAAAPLRVLNPGPTCSSAGRPF